MKRYHALKWMLIPALCMPLAAQAQTIISGGIFTNTTWTLSGSPYVVTGNVVLFPGLVLEIEPGVVIRFDGGYTLEIRQSEIQAIGTQTDSIIFTNNSPNPSAGSWATIYFDQGVSADFKYCSINSANSALSGYIDHLSVRNSTFAYNNYGITASSNNYAFVNNSLFTNNNTGIDWSGGTELDLRNSSFISNQTGFMTYTDADIRNCIFDFNAVCGIQKESGKNDTVRGNILTNNGIGYYATAGGGGSLNYIYGNVIENNGTGIFIYQAGAHQDTFYCNNICNNTTYNVRYELISNFNMRDNYWCSTDSAYIASTISDGYDNITYGLVNFIPMDTVQCASITTAVDDPRHQRNHLTLYPNPVNDLLSVAVSATARSDIKIFSISGNLIYESSFTGSNTVINLSHFEKGMYIIHLVSPAGNLSAKFIRM